MDKLFPIVVTAVVSSTLTLCLCKPKEKDFEPRLNPVTIHYPLNLEVVDTHDCYLGVEQMENPRPAEISVTSPYLGACNVYLAEKKVKQ